MPYYSYKIFHKITCKTTYLIHLLDNMLCKLQYLGKYKNSLNIQLKNHRKDVKRIDGIPASKHFNCNEHSFQGHAKFALIEKLDELKLDKKPLWKWLKTRQNYWIITLDTLHHKERKHGPC